MKKVVQAASNREKMSIQHCNKLADQMADAYIKKYDSSKDGKLDAAESHEMCGQIGNTVVDMAMQIIPMTFIQRLVADQILAGLKASVGSAENIFRDMDADGNGTLTKEEISAGLAKWFVTAGVVECARGAIVEGKPFW